MIEHIKDQNKEADPAHVQCMTDMERELKIGHAMDRLKSAGTADARREAWGEMKALIEGRSASRVAEMSAERGLQ